MNLRTCVELLEFHSKRMSLLIKLVYVVYVSLQTYIPPEN